MSTTPLEHSEHPLDPAREKLIQRVVGVLSVVVFVVVAVLLGRRAPEGASTIDVSMLPWVNAGINSLTTVVLVAGFVAIRTGRVGLHKALMTSAMALSAGFLVVYIVYHWFSPGPAEYHGSFRSLYLVVLASHVILATVILPLALTTWARGFVGAVSKHRRIAPLTLGLWLYVTITGVMIVGMAHG